MNSNGKEEEMYLTQTVSSEIPFPVKAPAKGKGSASSTIRTAHGGEHIVASAGEKVIAESDSCVVATEGSQVVALSGSKVIFTPGSEVTIHFGSEVIDPFGMRVKPRAPASKAARAEITGILDAYAPAPDEKLSTNQTANAAQKKLDDAAEIKRLLSELSSLIAQQQARQFGEISKIVRSLQTITISTGPVKRSGAKPQRNVDRRKFLRGKRSTY